MLIKITKYLGINSYVFVSLCITKDCIALLVLTHSLLYVDKIVRLRRLFQPLIQGLKTLMKWFEERMKSLIY